MRDKNSSKSIDRRKLGYFQGTVLTELKHIKEGIDELKESVRALREYLSQTERRIDRMEKRLSFIKGVGLTLFAIANGVYGYLFNRLWK